MHLHTQLVAEKNNAFTNTHTHTCIYSPKKSNENVKSYRNKLLRGDNKKSSAPAAPTSPAALIKQAINSSPSAMHWQGVRPLSLVRSSSPDNNTPISRTRCVELERDSVGVRSLQKVYGRVTTLKLKPNNRTLQTPCDIRRDTHTLSLYLSRSHTLTYVCA